MTSVHTARAHCGQYLYVLGHGSTWQNNELRYSLRSLDAFCPARKQVYIAGEKPEWIDWNRQDVAHIPLPETNANKVQRVGRKLIGALPYLREQDFVFMNDDFILTRLHDCPGGFYWGRRHRGTVLSHMNQVKAHYVTPRVSTAEHGAQYFRSMKRSYDRLTEAGCREPLGFNIHEPIDLCVDLVLTTGAFCPFWEGYSFRILYGNLHASDEDRARPPVFDMKVRQPQEIRPEWWSISLASNVEDPVRVWLEKQFPKKSRWER
jgi:hypothetical protein